MKLTNPVVFKRIALFSSFACFQLILIDINISEFGQLCLQPEFYCFSLFFIIFLYSIYAI